MGDTFRKKRARRLPSQRALVLTGDLQYNEQGSAMTTSPETDRSIVPAGVPAERTQRLVGLQSRVRTQLMQMLEDTAYAPVWERFRAAFEYRRQFPWLGESGYI